MKRLFNLERIAFGLAGFLLGLFGNVAGEWLAGSSGTVLMVFFGLLAATGLAALVVAARRPRHVRAELRAPITLRREQERRTYARRGVVVFVSLYKPGRDADAEALAPRERLAAAEALDYARLDLEHSNLKPAIEAVRSHAARIEHCWLISTSAATGGQAGSLAYVPVLIKYLREVKGVACSFHGGGEYAVSMDDDALVTVKTRDMVDGVFQEAERLGLAADDMVADFTGCPRSMTLGLILACLDGQRDIQFAGTHYDEQGQPVGPLFTVLFDFEPRLVE